MFEVCNMCIDFLAHASTSAAMHAFWNDWPKNINELIIIEHFNTTRRFLAKKIVS